MEDKIIRLNFVSISITATEKGASEITFDVLQISWRQKRFKNLYHWPQPELCYFNCDSPREIVKLKFLKTTLKHEHFLRTPLLIKPWNSHLAHEQLADSDPAIIPYKVMNRLFTTIYGLITGTLPAKFLQARYSSLVQFYCFLSPYFSRGILKTDNNINIIAAAMLNFLKKTAHTI